MPIIETTAELVARTYAEMEARLEVVRGLLRRRQRGRGLRDQPGVGHPLAQHGNLALVHVGDNGAPSSARLLFDLPPAASHLVQEVRIA